MFLGRGFAHLGWPPVYVGEVALALGVFAAAVALLVGRWTTPRSWVVVLLVIFMALGAARTLPYLERDGVNALRDAVLWGYALFALIVAALADRTWLLGATRLYGRVLPAFAIWLPIAWVVFVNFQTLIPVAPGGVPVLFFKNQDMAVHAVGALAFLVLSGAASTAPQFVLMTALAVPLTWGVYITGSISRGAVAAVAAGLAVLLLLARAQRPWAAVLTAALLVAIGVTVPREFAQPPVAGVPSVSPSASPSPRESAGPSRTPLPTLAPTPAPTPLPTPDRELSPAQWWENLASVFGTSNDENLEGTKQFRLAWWGKIVSYTVFGPYFWTGKGFGVNLADDDGFQPTADGSLRAPHNSHFSVLARMGVPGFVLWIVLQGLFAVQLLLATFNHRRSGDHATALAGAWILVYWAAMMVNTSFDPYLEGPQGGIWFWTLFGLGLVVIRESRRPAAGP